MQAGVMSATCLWMEKIFNPASIFCVAGRFMKNVPSRQEIIFIVAKNIPRICNKFQ